MLVLVYLLRITPPNIAGAIAIKLSDQYDYVHTNKNLCQQAFDDGVVVKPTTNSRDQSYQCLQQNSWSSKPKQELGKFYKIYIFILYHTYNKLQSTKHLFNIELM